METLHSLKIVEVVDHESQPAAESDPKKMTPETREKISKANLGKKLSPETKAKISAANAGKNHPMYGKRLSAETKAKISAANAGKNHPMYGKRLSAETKAKISAAKSEEKNPRWDQNFAAVRQAISLHADGMTMKEASLQLGFAERWLSNWKQKHPLRFRDFYTGESAISASEIRQARSLYEELDYGDDNKELLALYYGFGIYRRHSCEQIGIICGENQVWVIGTLGQIITRQRPPSYDLDFEVAIESRQPLFQIDSRFSTRQLQRLADILPKLERLEAETAVELFGLGGRRPKTIAEINSQLFQSASWGEQKIINIKRTLEGFMMSV